MKMWISKYALSIGISQEDGSLSQGESALYFLPKYGCYRVEVDAHEDRDEAIAAAEAMRAKRIASLKKQIAKLEKLDFSGDVE